MIKYGDYLIIESKKDFEENVIFERKNCVRLNCGVVYHNGDKENFPQFYKYDEPWDNHFCGDWYRCKKEVVIAHIEKVIARLQSDLDEDKNILNRIKGDN